MKTVYPCIYEKDDINNPDTFLLALSRSNKSLHDGLFYMIAGQSDTASISVPWSMYLQTIATMYRTMHRIASHHPINQWKDMWEKT